MQLELPELMDLNRYIDAERLNKFNAAKIKKNETWVVQCMAKSQLKPIEFISKVTLIFHHRDKRKDFDNVEFSQKFIWDGLVKAKIIKNDNWTCIAPEKVIKHDVRPTQPGVTVIIE